jgi:hypothetical protein
MGPHECMHVEPSHGMHEFIYFLNLFFTIFYLG